jgi:hypothetical protein
MTILRSLKVILGNDTCPRVTLARIVIEDALTHLLGLGLTCLELALPFLSAFLSSFGLC